MAHNVRVCVWSVGGETLSIIWYIQALLVNSYFLMQEVINTVRWCVQVLSLGQNMYRIESHFKDALLELINQMRFRQTAHIDTPEILQMQY